MPQNQKIGLLRLFHRRYDADGSKDETDRAHTFVWRIRPDTCGDEVEIKAAGRHGQLPYCGCDGGFYTLHSVDRGRTLKWL